jgi:hypothetical protein
VLWLKDTLRVLRNAGEAEHRNACGCSPANIGVSFTWAQPQRSIGQGSPDIRSGKRPADENKIRGGGRRLVGLGRVELPTSPLSGVRSSQLSYRPANETEAIHS